MSGGSGGPAGLGGGERVGEHQRRIGELATGSFEREEGRKRGLRGRPASGGAKGGRRWPFSAKGRAGLGSRAQERRREGQGRL